MDAKGLQIGNYVQDIISGEWMIVDELGENIGATLINRDKYPLPDGWQMGPIPLTPEVLKKAGFGKTEFGQFDLEKDSFSWDTYRKKMILDIWDGIDLDHVEYLHQLQNIYLLIEGEELQIEL